MDSDVVKLTPETLKNAFDTLKSMPMIVSKPTIIMHPKDYKWLRENDYINSDGDFTPKYWKEITKIWDKDK